MLNESELNTSIDFPACALQVNNNDQTTRFDKKKQKKHYNTTVGMDCGNEEKSITELEHDSMAGVNDDEDLDTGNHSDDEGSGGAPNAMSEHPRRLVWRIEDCPRT